MNNDILLNELIKNKDLKYKEFNDKIVNTNMLTIGVRMPILKAIVNKILKEDYEAFLKNISNDYYEQTLIEGLLISKEKDVIKLLSNLDGFLDKIDCWAICDSVCFSCKAFLKDKDIVIKFVKDNLRSTNPWRVRFSFVTLLSYFIDTNYLDFIFKVLDNDKNDFYYVMMAKAWLISACYIKYPKETLKYLCNTKIDDITYNKAISKICDSYRISKKDKINLKKMKKMTNNA